MMDDTRVRELLSPFDIHLNDDQVAKLLVYLDVLMRWNSKINLTAIRQPEECVTRHFGESLYLSVKVELHGSLLDIGSGAGFPGLALMIVFPNLAVTLLEPSTRKRAFLKEVARACQLNSVDVRQERIEDYQMALFDAITTRAVGGLCRLLTAAVPHLKQEGSIFAWVTRRQARDLSETGRLVAWGDPLPIPLSSAREIWHGSRQPTTGRQ